MKRRQRTASARSRIDWILVTLLLAALALRLIWMLTGPQVMENEGGVYTRIAENLLRGRGFESIYGTPETMYTLMLPLLIAASKLIFVNSDVAARMVAVVVGTSLVAPVYLLSRQLYGRTAAAFGGALVAVSPMLIGFSVAVYTETPYMLFVMTGSYFGLRALGFTGTRHYVLAGLFWGLAYVTRPEGIAYLLLMVVALWIAAWVTKKPLRLALRASLIVGVTGMLVAAPYMFYLWQQTGHVRLEGKNLINYTIIKRMEAGMLYDEAAWGIDENLDETGPLLVPNRYAAYSPYPFGLADLLQNLPRQLKHNSSELFQQELPSFSMGAPVLWVLVIIGLFRRSWDRVRTGKEMFVFSLVGYALMILMLAHVILFRYVMLLFPFLLIWASNGLKELADWAQQTAGALASRKASSQERIGRAAWWGTCSVTILLFVVFGIAGTRYLPEINEGFSENLVVKRAGEWLKQQAPGPKKIMDVSSYVPYYADGSLAGLPEAPADLALRYIDKVNPDFVVLWADYAFRRRYIRDWIEHGIPSPKAELIYTAGEKEGKKLVIYKWRHDSAT
jgi:4-amino-4-deoxy-L-arabinose transferase-like glycosyltransferase